MKRIKLLFLLFCLILVNTACTKQTAIESAKNVNFEKYINGYQCNIKIFCISKGTSYTYNEINISKQDPPFSTFKILHALIALEVGVLKDENTLKKWDGKKRTYDSHNQDHTLKSAMRDSVVWYFQETAREIGPERMQEYLNKVGYGNSQIGKSIDSFWLIGPLKVNVDDQINFITRLYKEELPFKKSVIKTVKNIIVNEVGKKYSLSGKTGTGELVNNKQTGWYVGYITTDKDTYTFTTKIQGGEGSTGTKAKEITKEILKEIKLIID